MLSSLAMSPLSVDRARQVCEVLSSDIRSDRGIVKCHVPVELFDGNRRLDLQQYGAREAEECASAEMRQHFIPKYLLLSAYCSFIQLQLLRCIGMIDQ